MLRIHGRMSCYLGVVTRVIAARVRQKQEGHREYEASLVFIASFKPARTQR